MSARKAWLLAKRIVKDQLPGQWIVKSLGKESRDFSVHKRGKAVNPQAIAAFELAHKLRRHRDVEDCEVALVMPTTAPEQMRAQRAVRASSTGSSAIDLTCSSDRAWVLDACSIQQAWQLPLPSGGKRQGAGIIVGHPDTGYSDHPELNVAGRLLKNQGYDFEDDDADARDSLSGTFGGHGTATGSVIMSGDGTGSEITGVAPQCKLVPLRVTNSVVLLSFRKLAEAIRYAADRNHHVLSISLGGPLYSGYMQRAVQYAVERGVIVCAAAGNVWPFVVYPARLDQVIACAATNCQRVVWADSASGPAVDIAAPGESVWRALAAPSGFSVGRSSGTSFSTAIVAGVAALWLAHHNRDKLIARYGLANLAGVFKEQLLTHGFTRPPNWNTANLGPGVLNAKKLLAAELPTTAPARGVRAARSAMSARGVQKSSLDELLELFPTADPSTVRHGLMRMLHVGEHELNGKLAEVGDEIAYHAVTDMDFRHQLSSATPTVSTRSARRKTTSKSTGDSTSSRVIAPIPRNMSRNLKKLVLPKKTQPSL